MTVWFVKKISRKKKKNFLGYKLKYHFFQKMKPYAPDLHCLMKLEYFDT